MAKADREPAIIYCAWCPPAGQTEEHGYSELAAIDAQNAAVIHASRMQKHDFDRAAKLCGTNTVSVAVRDPSDDSVTVFAVIRTMVPEFKVLG